MVSKCEHFPRCLIVVPLVLGMLLILFCFITCPSLWLRLPRTEFFSYRVGIFLVAAVIIWALVVSCVFCCWRWRTAEAPYSRRELEAVEDA